VIIISAGIISGLVEGQPGILWNAYRLRCADSGWLWFAVRSANLTANFPPFRTAGCGIVCGIPAISRSGVRDVVRETREITQCGVRNAVRNFRTMSGFVRFSGHHHPAISGKTDGV
jgi:hypothetical protein